MTMLARGNPQLNQHGELKHLLLTESQLDGGKIGGVWEETCTKSSARGSSSARSPTVRS